MRKFYGLNDTLKFLPTIYIGNKCIDEYVKDANIIVVKNNNTYYTTNNQYLNISFKNNYNKIVMDPSIKKEHLKVIKITYRISNFLINIKSK
jgi:hypothetical protein